MLAGRRAVPGEPAVGLPVPHPVLEGAGDLRDRGARARSARDGAARTPSACHFAEARAIVETVDVSDVEPDTRFTATDLRDDGLDGEDPSDLERMRERHRTLSGDADHAPQEVTRLIDEQPGDHRPPNA